MLERLRDARVRRVSLAARAVGYAVLPPGALRLAPREERAAARAPLGGAPASRAATGAHEWVFARGYDESRLPCRSGEPGRTYQDLLLVIEQALAGGASELHLPSELRGQPPPR